MDDPNEVIGHKTFYENGQFRHEPLTRAEGDALIAQVEAAEAKRAADMPTDKDAVERLWEAHYRLKELGWHEARSCPRELRQEGVTALLIEIGSAGIHEGYYHAVDGKDVWWIGPEGCPCSPVLVKPARALASLSEGGGTRTAPSVPQEQPEAKEGRG